MPHAARPPALALTLGFAVLLAAAAAAPAGPSTRPDAPAAGKAEAKVDAKPDAKPAAERAPLPPVGVVRELGEDERNEAIADRDTADRLRGAFEAAHRGPAAKAGGVEAAAFNDVVAAYHRAIGRFPGTEIECYCRLGLAGAYQYRGQFDAAMDEQKQAAERFAGTRPGLEATQAVALTYLQAVHDPAQAAVWFRQLRTAAGAARDDDERVKWQTAAAEGLARCEAEAKPVKPAKK